MQHELRERLLASFATIVAIYRKELKDTLRDRRTLATMLLVPMVLYPLLVIAVSEMVSATQSTVESRRFVVRPSSPLPPVIRAALAEAEDLEFIDAPLALTSSSARDALATRECDIVIAASATAADSLGALGTAAITIYYDETRPFSGVGVARTRAVLNAAARRIVDDRMAGLGLPLGASRPLQLRAESVATSAEVGGQLAALYLPVLILFFIALSSFYPAVDLTAGEKERGTLATLLCAPIHTIEIVWGKYLAVVTVGMLAGLLNVTVMALTMMRAVATAPGSFSAALPPMSPSIILGLLAAATALAAFVGALMLVSAALARSFRDASNLLTPVLFAALAPGLFSVLPSAELSPLWAAVPIANGVLLMKGLLLGRASLSLAVATLLSTAAYTALLLAVAARVFRDERVLFSTEGRRVEITSLLLSPPRPGVGAALAFTAVLFVGNYYASLASESLGPALGVPLVQVMVHALPALALAWWIRPFVPPRELLLQHAPSGRAMGAAVLVAVGAWLGISLPILWLQDAVLPGQSAAAEALEAMLGLKDMPLPVALFALAVAPAVAEELAFRGAILGLLRRQLSSAGAVALQAILFGMLHASLFRFMPTAALGAVLGCLAVRSRSIWPGVLAHALTNAIAVTLHMTAPEAVAEHLGRPSAVALLGVALTSLGLFIAQPKSSN